MKLVILGDSHVVALGKAYSAQPASYISPLPRGLAIEKLFSFPDTLKPFFQRLDGGQIVFSDPNISAILNRLIGRVNFEAGDVNVYVFSMAFTTTILVRMGIWRKYRPWRVQRDSQRPLSDAVVKEIALEHFKHIIAFFRALHEQGLKVAALEAPPPRLDEPVITRYLGAEALLEIDRLGREAVADALTELGVPIVHAPADSYDDSTDRRGFLKSEFCKAGTNDFHHANVRFGELALPSVLAMGAKLSAPSSEQV